ncbi:helix-turn-helix domain-containing protein [Gorillibacterium sp. sgz500922]|uniref:helix-turn-helix domain-containing protein n=1 Tax=Gorillibacterium sp. sgz500922 TaxID=3446694 RepID=UPI003F66C462
MNEVVLIILQGCLLPERSIAYHLRGNEYLYLESHSKVHLTMGTVDMSLADGDLILAQDFLLHNLTDAPAYYRAVLLDLHDGHHPPGPIISTIDPVASSHIRSLLEPLFSDCVSCHNQDLISTYLTTLSTGTAESCAASMDDPPKAPSNRIDSRLIKVNRYLRQNHEKIITLQDLAALIDCNPVYLSNRYSMVFNMSPMKHLQQMKIEKAKELLATTKLKVSLISQRLGYISTSQFSLLFKRYTGYTPTEFRNTEH